MSPNVICIYIAKLLAQKKSLLHVVPQPLLSSSTFTASLSNQLLQYEDQLYFREVLYLDRQVISTILQLKIMIKFAMKNTYAYVFSLFVFVCLLVLLFFFLAIGGISLREISRGRNAPSKSTCTNSFIRYCQFPSQGLYHFASCQQCIRVPVWYSGIF